MDRAIGPLPSTMSSWKSSIAGYRISSTARPSRWISSMNSTSPSVRSLRMAARSPARTSAGPDVTRRPTPISAATMPARLVLPSPGGPANNRGSAGCPRRRAASSTISRCSLGCNWPTNSASRRGRSPLSSAASTGSAAAASTSSRGLTPHPAADVHKCPAEVPLLYSHRWWAASPGPRQRLQSGPQQVLHLAGLGQPGQSLPHLVVAVAQTGQGDPDLGPWPGGGGVASGQSDHRKGHVVGVERHVQLGLELDQQPHRGLL